MKKQSTSEKVEKHEEMLRDLKKLSQQKQTLQKKRDSIDKEIDEVHEQIKTLQDSLIDFISSFDSIPPESQIAKRPFKEKRVDKRDVIQAFKKGIPRDLFLGSTNMKSVDRWIAKLENGEQI